jgi:penicillin amidase
MEDWVAALGEYAKTALRPIEGRLRFSSLSAEVEILTDTWGVPHVYASTLDDLFFAQGFLHAAERLWQFDFMRRVSLGRLSEIVGPPGLALDRFFRTVGLGRLAHSQAKKIDEESRSAAGPYFSGFHAAVGNLPRPVEYQLLDLQPDISEDPLVDTIAISLLMSFSLSPNWPFELLRAELAAQLLPERARELTPLIGAEPPVAVPSSPDFPAAARALRDAAWGAGVRPGLGSNNWVVDGTKSATGKPLLANDPHLLVQMPAIWMEMHLACPQMEVAGVTLPGIPGVVIGHNRRIAWGFTNTQADVTDLYVERVSDDGSHYEFKGTWRRMKRIRERIAVRGEPKPLLHEVRETRHGPLVTSIIAGGTSPEVIEGRIAEAVSLRWIQRDVPATLRSVLMLNRADGWHEFLQAARAWPIAGQNMIYADVEGNIGYQFTGVVPIRAKGAGVVPVPGWTGDYEWGGTIPFDELPTAFNPPQGLVATANHRVVDLDYPYTITHDWEMGYRARRIVSMLTAAERLSSEDFATMHSDTFSGLAADLVPLVLQAEVSGERETEALKRIETWDLRLDADSVPAAIFNAWFARLAEALFAGKLGPQLYDEYYLRKAWTTNWAYDAARAILANPQAFWIGGDGTDNAAARDRLLGRTLESACEDLEARLGPDMVQWRWGRLHRVHFRHVLANAIPQLDELLSSGPYEVGGGDDTINRGVIYPAEGFADGAIASWRGIIDLADFDRSLGVITTGNSGNPASPYFRDQSELWARGAYHPMPFSRHATEAAAVGRLLLVPR